MTAHLRTDSQRTSDAHKGDAVGAPPASSHQAHVAHPTSAAGIPSLATTGAPTPTDDASSGTLDQQPPMVPSSTQVPIGGGWLELRVWAEMFADHQAHRIASENRACSNWKDPRPGIDPETYQPHIDALIVAENACRLEMVRCYRRVVPAPIREWQQSSRGIGEHTLARVLGHLGHPVIAHPFAWMPNAPDGHVCDPSRCGASRHLVAGMPFARTVGQLWAYCGHGDPARSRRVKGATADDVMGAGNPTLKKLTFLMAEACVKASGDGVYRKVYDDARARYADRVHAGPCARCGPSGHPAPEGSPWAKGHQHGAALRLVGKSILRDLYVATLDHETDLA